MKKRIKNQELRLSRQKNKTPIGTFIVILLFFTLTKAADVSNPASSLILANQTSLLEKKLPFPPMQNCTLGSTIPSNSSNKTVFWGALGGLGLLGIWGIYKLNQKEVNMVVKPWSLFISLPSIICHCLGLVAEGDIVSLSKSLQVLNSNQEKDLPPKLFWEKNDCWLCALVAVLTNAKLLCEIVEQEDQPIINAAGAFAKLVKAMKEKNTKNTYQQELANLLKCYTTLEVKGGYDAGIGVSQILEDLPLAAKKLLKITLTDDKGNTCEKLILHRTITTEEEWKSPLATAIKNFKDMIRKTQGTYQITSAPTYILVHAAKSINQVANGTVDSQTSLTTNTNDSVTYTLTGLVIDTGGHSTAYLKKPSGWYKADYGPSGSTISLVEDKEALGPWAGESRPRLLLYEKKDEKKEPL